MHKPNILIAHNYYQTRGGEDSVFENEYKLLVDNHYNVTKYVRKSNELKVSTLRKILLPFTSVFSLKTYKEVNDLIKSNKIELIHCHNTFPLISPSIYYAAFKNKIPVVQTVHNFRFVCPNALLYRGNRTCLECVASNSLFPALRNRCYHSSFFQTLVLVLTMILHRSFGTFKKINYIFLTEFSAEKFNKLIDLNGNNIFIKGNFVEVSSCERNISNHKTFVYIGRLEPEKGIVDLLDYWKKLPTDYELKILGKGSLESYICEELKGKSNMFYLGQRDKNFVLDTLCSATSMIFPSKLIENFPMTIIESFSVGCPVISYNFGNGAALVKKSGGGIVYDDFESFEKAISDIVENNDEFSKYAKKFYLENSTGNYCLNALMKIYSTILKDKENG